MNALTFNPIGYIRTPFQEKEGMPIQPGGAENIRGRVELLPELEEGLKDLDGFSHIILLYHFHRSKGFTLKVSPFLDKEQRGLFSTRAPQRPNPIGISIVKLEGIRGCRIDIAGVDMLDNTPLLDIKPYVPDFDVQANVKTGWLEKASAQVHNHKSDNRFDI